MEIQRMIELVRGAQSILMDENAARQVTVKGVADYVTQVDLRVQAYFQQRLAALDPQAAFLAEEKENEKVAGKPAWILDPVDGTTNLIHDYRMSAVSLAYYDGASVACGVVYNPFTQELFTAQRGGGAFLNGVPIRCSAARTMDDCLAAIGTAPYYKAEAAQNFALFQKVFLACQDIRRSGSAALDLCYVACGRIDAYFERHLKPWDYAAGLLLVQEAGGCVTDWQGHLPEVTKPGNVLATNGKLHEQFLELL
ncbi:MAG TPA: inositol monophosphatase [Candidatus Fimivicinus intestinavium]|nr:inositol monophosphatase [Candidatus Fimivicinus intestinavium]